MGIPEWIAVVSVVIALASLAIQQHFGLRQSRFDTRVKHYDRTQDLLFKALEDPELLEALSGGSFENQKQRRYRQLWFNHIKLIYDQRKLFEKGDWEVTVEDISSFFNMPAMQTHWFTFQQYYSPDFRKFVNETIIKKAEAPVSEAPPEIMSE